MIDRSEIRFEHDEVTEDDVLWIDLVWENFRLEKGHSMDDQEWAVFHRGRYLATVRSIRKAKDEILDTLEI